MNLGVRFFWVDTDFLCETHRFRTDEHKFHREGGRDYLPAVCILDK